MGYLAVRAQSGIPGVLNAYGVGRGKLYYEPAGRQRCPLRPSWDTPKYLSFAPQLFERLRERYGFDVHLCMTRTIG